MTRVEREALTTYVNPGWSASVTFLLPYLRLLFFFQ